MIACPLTKVAYITLLKSIEFSIAVELGLHSGQ